ncbi:uncharacterized protein LOC123265308 isoform X2 [Cotesia glomerata]|uniref:uncharacterized protein LOC123265308 isoform X2 n=1 Tax=Cotesia glomerata TaxID=32391 RepID=UPI001D007EE4|nr:uncharacterized protein LOC123265308 isoform X2 [Cotesia glomerata]
MMTKSSIVKDVEWAIGSHRTLLQINGLWIYSEKHSWLEVVMNIQTLLLTLSIFGFVTLPQTIALMKTWGNVTLIGDNIMSNLPVTMAGIKLIKMWTNKKILVRMVKRIENDWYQLSNNTERDVMIKYAKIPKLMLLCGLINITSSTLFYHILSNFFGITLRATSNLTDIYGDKILPLQSVYFFDLSTTLSFYFISWSQLFGSLVASLVYTTFDITFGLFVLHTCALLENLSERIHNIPMGSEVKLQKILKSIVLQHCALIRFVGRIEEIFSTVLLGLVISFGVLFSVLGFQIVVSDSLNDAIYNCDWTLLIAKDRRQMILLLLNSQRKLCVTVGGVASVSLDTFAKLIKTSAGYISVLLAAKE